VLIEIAMRCFGLIVRGYTMGLWRILVDAVHWVSVARFVFVRYTWFVAQIRTLEIVKLVLMLLTN